MPFRVRTSCPYSSFSLVETEVFLLVLPIDTETRYSKERVIWVAQEKKEEGLS